MFLFCSWPQFSGQKNILFPYIARHRYLQGLLFTACQRNIVIFLKSRLGKPQYFFGNFFPSFKKIIFFLVARLLPPPQTVFRKFCPCEQYHFPEGHFIFPLNDVNILFSCMVMKNFVRSNIAMQAI